MRHIFESCLSLGLSLFSVPPSIRPTWNLQGPELFSFFNLKLLANLLRDWCRDPCLLTIISSPRRALVRPPPIAISPRTHGPLVSDREARLSSAASVCLLAFAISRAHHILSVLTAIFDLADLTGHLRYHISSLDQLTTISHNLTGLP
jgi:hypothetical protein